jgi:hypothetical protein
MPPDNLVEGVPITAQGAGYKLRITAIHCCHRSLSNHTAGYVPAKAKEVTGNLSFDFAVLSGLEESRSPWGYTVENFGEDRAA